MSEQSAGTGTATADAVRPIELYSTPTGVANAQITGDAPGWFASASQSGGTPVWALTLAIQAGYTAMSNGSSLGDAGTQITQAASAAGETSPDLGNCVAVATAVCQVLSGNLNLWGDLLSSTDVGVVLVANNSQYQLSTATAPSSGQLYIKHGAMPVAPAGAVSFVPPPPQQNISIGIFGVNAVGLYGPSGVIGMTIIDTNTNNYLGELCIAYSFPISGSNSCAVAFNQTLSSFYDSFNSGVAAMTGTATLAAQTVGGVSYPALTATCGLDQFFGNLDTIGVYIAAS